MVQILLVSGEVLPGFSDLVKLSISSRLFFNACYAVILKCLDPSIFYSVPNSLFLILTPFSVRTCDGIPYGIIHYS